MHNIYVVGTPRSGTTLLQNILIKNSNLISFTESHYYFERYYNLLDRFDFPPVFSDKVYIRRPASLSRGNFSTFYRDNDIKYNENNSFEFSLNEEAKRQMASGWVEKTPAHIRRIPIILKRNNDAKFIFIYRNFYDVKKSWESIQAKHDIDCNIFVAKGKRLERHWKRDINRIEHYVKKDPSKYCCVSYENICRFEDDCLSRLMSWIGLKREEFEIPVVGVKQFEKWKGNNTKSTFLNSSATEMMEPSLQKLYSRLEKLDILNSDFLKEGCFEK
ncbi:sulfotransferase [Pseudoalteromonas sp. D15MCD-2]|uniref:sulfotransferase family protein n=1 Tax=Pseudoalteromonas sp. D15MCD-2 TaxID=3138933 RepID=UPI0031587401